MRKYRGFQSSKATLRYDKVSLAQRRRWLAVSSRNQASDHLYALSDRPTHDEIDTSTTAFTGIPNIADVDHEEVVPEQMETVKSTNSNWRHGRRVIELGVLADALKACLKCGMPLQLSHAVDIQTYGLSAIIKIPCSNTHCVHLNNVPTGKRHGKVWDANTKLAAAMVHSGMGERHVNSFLSSLNIPAVSHKTISRRQRETGTVIQSVAKESTEIALVEEIALTEKKREQDGLVVSVDAGWQKRGSGRSYDSLSGHSSMIGTLSGKIVNFSTRSKSCHTCSLSLNTESSPPPHDCSINWHGSAKGMESDMIEEMVKDVNSSHVSITAIVGDEDSTTISRIRANIDNNIKKISDANHVKKIFGNHLYSMKKEHKSLTFKVIQYLQRCFNHLLAQGKGNATQIGLSLKALSFHPFGDHSRWCRFLENPKEQYHSLPHGKPLSDRHLQSTIHHIMETYAANAEKLAALGSTQGNESFNRLVASKAPKANHYSSSSSLKFRVAASVLQKNEGHRYVMHVNRRLGLSPGYFTQRLAKIRDIQHKKRKAIATTFKAKQKRRLLKSKRQQGIASMEVREGVTYSEGVNFQHIHPSDVQEIPPPSHQPSLETCKTLQSLDKVIFDIEATGLARTSHILQISAIREEDHFNQYILPKTPISKKAEEITGLKMNGSKMYHNHTEVSPLPIRLGLLQFLDFLSKEKKTVIIGHNIISYDIPVLMNALKNCGIVDKFTEKVHAICDTLQLFKTHSPGLKSYSQVKLYQHFLGEDYAAHDSLQDVVALHRLLHHVEPSFETTQNLTFSLDSFINRADYNKKAKINMSTLSPLTDAKVISQRMSHSIAYSGLSYVHLQLAYQRNGRQGIMDLLMEDVNGKARVTRSKKNMDSISDFFQSKDPEV